MCNLMTKGDQAMATKTNAGGRVRHVCGVCGSAKVYRDASAKWSEERQQWVLSGIDDDAYCEACEDDTVIIERPL